MTVLERRDSAANDPVSEGQRLTKIWPLQEGHWLAHKVYEPDPGLVWVRLGLSGPLDRSTLTVALGELVNRHSMLRSVIREVDGEPMMQQQDRSDLELRLVDAEACSSDGRVARLSEIERGEQAERSDVTRLVQRPWTLVRWGPEEHTLLFAVHHLFSDGFALLRVFPEELANLYRAKLDDLEYPPPPAISYAQFAERICGAYTHEKLEEKTAFWREYLSDAPRALLLPTDHLRPPILTTEARDTAVVLSAELSARLAASAETLGASPAEVLFAAYMILLGRYTGQSDIVCGVPQSTRSRKDDFAIMGCCMNTVVRRTNLSGEPTFSELLERLWEDKKTTILHSQTPTSAILRAAGEVSSDRDLSRHPCYQASFNYLPFGDSHHRAGELEIEVGLPRQASLLDLTFQVIHREAELHLTIRHRVNLFEEKTVERMARHFENILDRAISEPALRISDIPCLDAGERETILADWNDVSLSQEPERTGTLLERFESYAAKTPDSAAVGGERIRSYGEIEARANQVARRLRSLGVGSESVVGIYLDRCTDVVVAMLGIMKAGGAYVPLDPKLPSDRVSYMVDDSGARVVLAKSTLPPSLGDERKILWLDREQDWQDVSTERLPSVVSTRNLVYVIYTSGSTGRPKGVAVEHAQVMSYIDGFLDRMKLGAGLSYATVSSISADSGNSSIFGALATGGCVHVIDENTLMEGSRLDSYLREHSVDCLKIMPSHLMALQSGLGPASVLPSECLVVGGEASPTSWMAGLRRASSCRVFNHYGPTECTVGTLAGKVLSPDELESKGVVAMGRPMSGSRAYCLDGAVRVAPVGVAGELHLGGGHVTRGYLGRPALTAERFVPDPYSPRPGYRMYRTGDLARWDDTGVLEYLGRSDNQIKIRGFRIELDEIEAALQGYPLVREAIVLVRGEGNSKRLVAYVVGGGDADLEADELRAYCVLRLPDYMVPRAFVLLDHLPITRAGKVDRKALPVPDDDSFLDGESFVAPRTSVEQQLADMWQELLGRERVGISDNFFSLGGHSLLTMQVISRIKGVFGVSLPIRRLFELPTIEGIAGEIGRVKEADDVPTIPELLPAERSETQPLSYAQRRLWFLSKLDPNNASYHQPRVRRLRGLLNIEALRRAFDELVGRQEILRAVFVEGDGGGESRQKIVDPYPWQLPIEDLSGLESSSQETEVDRLVHEEIGRSFDLERGPLLRTRLLKISPTEHVLVAVVHHIVSDGWSMDVFKNELEHFYTAFSTSTAPDLAPLPIQYVDYAIWQRNWLSGAVLEEQVSYWRERLRGGEHLDLATKAGRPNSRSNSGDVVTVTINRELTAKLRAIGLEHGATQFMTLLAAFRVLLFRYTGQSDFCIGTPTAGRTHRDVEPLIGFFLNTLVLRTEVDAEAGFVDLLARERSTLLEAHAHQDVPFEIIVDAVAVERDLSRNPLFDVLFLQVEGAEIETFADLGWTEVPSESLGAKFDISVYAKTGGECLEFDFVYATELFDVRTVQRMAEQFESLLEEIVDKPQAPIVELGLGQSPVEFEFGLPIEKVDLPLIHEMVEQVAAANPDAVAIRKGGREWTRDELWLASSEIAAMLAASDIRPGQGVGLRGRPSFGLIASMLGILRSGASLVPISSRLGREAICEMMRRAEAPVLMQVGKPGFVGDDWFSVADIDPDSAATTKQSTHSKPTLPSISADARAYVYFTSGTTGPQKGVVGQHQALSHFISWQANTFADLAGPVCAQLTHIGFDVFLRDVLFPITAGKVLSLPPDEVLELQVDELLRWMDQEKISAIHTVPSLARSWLNDCPDDVSLQSLQCVFMAGEPLTDSLVDEWRRRFRADTEFINLYGPTETTLAKCFYRIGVVSVAGVQPVGQPLPQTQVAIARDGRFLCAVGEPGEIVIRTPYRSLGYLDQGSSENAKFYPNPFREDSEDILYRTGDRGVHREDGLIGIFGRMDDQVKIRGQRVDPIGVASLLLNHPDVGDGVVMAVDDPSGERRLVAYVVPVGKELDGKGILGFLRERLPTYMVPSAIVPMAQLPKTPRGKLDKRALPEPSWGSAVEFVAPQSREEETIARLVADLLELERVGRNDDFFMLGGHSLLLLRLVRHVEREFGLRLRLSDVFLARTVVEIAALVASPRGQVKRPVVEDPEDEEVSSNNKEIVEAPLSFANHAFYTGFTLDEATVQPFDVMFSYRINGPLDTEILKRSLQAIISRHEILRTLYRNSEEGLVQRILPITEMLDVGTMNISGLATENVEEVGLKRLGELLSVPLDCRAGPIVRAGLANLGEGTHLLGVVIAHSNFDGSSRSRFLYELKKLYSGFVAGKSDSEILPPPTQYRRLMTKVARRGESQSEYWKGLLRGARPIELPCDFARDEVDRERAEKGYALRPRASCGRVLSREYTAKLDALVARLDESRFAVLLAGLIRTLHESAGQDDLCIFNSIALRQDVEAESVVGLMINPMIIRVQIEKGLDTAGLVRRTRAAWIEGVNNGEAPVIEIMSADLHRVNFNYQPWSRGTTERLSSEIEMTALNVPSPGRKRQKAINDFHFVVRSDSEGGLQLGMNYMTELFKRETAEAFLDEYRGVLIRMAKETPEGDA